MEHPQSRLNERSVQRADQAKANVEKHQAGFSVSFVVGVEGLVFTGLGALIIRLGFRGILYSKLIRNPQNSIGNCGLVCVFGFWVFLDVGPGLGFSAEVVP